ncbi:MAG TPA: ice-binding family protein [Labilithrix sp.]
MASFACASAQPDSSAEQRGADHGGLGGAAPLLGSAQTFAVLAGSTVTNTGPTTVSGDLGVNPGLAITGFPPGIVTDGVTHAGDALSLQAQTDVTAAYGVLAGEACDTDLSGTDLGGLTLVPGVYCFSSSAQLTGALVLDAGGHADAVFVFKMVSTLTTASNASVRVINGGGDCNVFWQVGSSATVGTGTTFVGSILALTSISLATGASISGRALARNGAVTMDDNAVTNASCKSVVAMDAGAPDAAHAPDAAPTDSGMGMTDAGSPTPDAGSPTPDAGASDGSTTTCDADTTDANTGPSP